MDLKPHINKLWFGLVAASLANYLIFPHWFTRESIAEFLNQFGPAALAVFIVLSLIRSLFLIPSTPLILAGAVAFPSMPLTIMLISMLGIAVGAFLIYSFPSLGNYDQIVQAKYPDKITALKQKMQHKYALVFVAAWAVFPLVPTDVICYVAGHAKMRFSRMIVPLLIGELPLVALYSFVGAEFGDWLGL